MWYLTTTGINLIIAIIICHHSRDVHAVVQQCVTRGCNVRCRRLSFNTTLVTSCSADVHRNGVPLNDTDKVFAITSLKDYGVYSCCIGSGVVQYYAMPYDCDGECTSIPI